MIKKIGFLTGTRADYGKIKSLLELIQMHSNKFEIHLLVTGMHLEPKYGSTVNQILDDSFGQIYFLPNQGSDRSMELCLSRTIEQISNFFDNVKLDMLIVHGDRIEALAGAITCSLRNIPVGHIEGGELSGTVDGILRHSISKLVNVHFVANQAAKNRLIQLGENSDSIHVIGSPDIDIILGDNLPSIEDTKKRYEIEFESFSILIFHPVTNELGTIRGQTRNVCEAVLESGLNYIVIAPNNDLGTEIVQDVIEELLIDSRFKYFPSMRFENFLSCLKNADFIVGNSSAGIREAGYFGVPCINIGTRQKSRHSSPLIIDVEPEKIDIRNAILQVYTMNRKPEYEFGRGDSATNFIEIIQRDDFWPVPVEKEFVDITHIKED